MDQLSHQQPQQQLPAFQKPVAVPAPSSGKRTPGGQDGRRGRVPASSVASWHNVRDGSQDHACVQPSARDHRGECEYEYDSDGVGAAPEEEKPVSHGHASFSSGDSFATAQPIGKTTSPNPDGGKNPGTFSDAAHRRKRQSVQLSERAEGCNTHCPECTERANDLAGIEVAAPHSWARVSDQDFFEALEVEVQVEARQKSLGATSSSTRAPEFKMLAGGKVAVHRVAPTYALTSECLRQHCRAVRDHTQL